VRTLGELRLPLSVGATRRKSSSFAGQIQRHPEYMEEIPRRELSQGGVSMPKENIRKVLGVTAAVFARMGQLSPEEALEMSGLDKQAFDEAMHKAQMAEDELKAAKKEPSFYDIVSKAADEYMNAVKK
jgi:hypothetical protein